MSCLPSHFLSLFPLLHPDFPPAPLTLPVTPRRAACPTLFASTCVLSTRHIWGEAPPPCSCQIIHLRVFIPCVLCLCNLCSRRRGQLFPSHSVPFFFLYFFESTHKESRKFPTSTEETAVRLGLCKNTAVFAFPPKFTDLSLPWMMMRQ